MGSLGTSFYNATPSLLLGRTRLYMYTHINTIVDELMPFVLMEKLGPSKFNRWLANHDTYLDKFPNYFVSNFYEISFYKVIG